MAIEQWWFFSVPDLRLHGTSVYKGHFRGPVTLTFYAKRLAVELSPPFPDIVYNQMKDSCKYCVGESSLTAEHQLGICDLVWQLPSSNGVIAHLISSHIFHFFFLKNPCFCSWRFAYARQFLKSFAKLLAVYLTVICKMCRKYHNNAKNKCIKSSVSYLLINRINSNKTKSASKDYKFERRSDLFLLVYNT